MAAGGYEEMTPDQRGEELFKASDTGNLEAVNILIGMETNMEYVDQYTQTPLLIAALNGHTEIVARLLAAGANKEAADRYGKTPLWNASWKGRTGIVELLLAANVNKEPVVEYGATPLYAASVSGHPEVVKRLLIAGANREAVDEHGQTPLFAAVIKGHIEVIRHLLGAGANVDVTNNKGVLLKNQIPNEDVKKIFDTYSITTYGRRKHEFHLYEVGDTITVPIGNRREQKAAATVVEVTPRRYVVTPHTFRDMLYYLFENDRDLGELIQFVFPHLVTDNPDKGPVEDLSDTNPYKRNARLLELLRSLNDPSDSLDERNKKISEIRAMNDRSINSLISASYWLMNWELQGIKVEFEYSPRVFAYYINKGYPSYQPEFVEKFVPNAINTGIISIIPKYTLEQVLAIEEWVKDNVLPYYLARPDIVKTVLTSPFVLNTQLWRDFQNWMDHDFDLLYDAASPTTEELILYRGSAYWPDMPIRRRTIFATSTRRLADDTDFGRQAIVKIPPGTRILDLSKDFNTDEAEVLVFPSVRDANMVIEPQPGARGERNTYVIRNVRNGNEHLPRSRRRSRRNNQRRRSTRRRRS